MSGGLLNEATLRDKLVKINTTQQTIETTSAWVCFFPKEARRIALIWEDVFSKADQAKRLALVYLANDVLQNSRKKGPEFVTEFFKVLPRALRHMLSKADEKTAASVYKVVRVWEERRVFGSGSKSFKQLMEESEAAGTRSKPYALPAVPSPGAPEQQLGGPSVPTSPTSPAAALGAAAKMPSLEPLVQALQQVRQAALHCTQLSAACGAAAAAAAGGTPGDVAASKAGLQQYLVALHQEREARQAAARALQALLRTQEEAGGRLASQLEQAAAQLEALEDRRRQLSTAGASAAAPALPAVPQEVQHAQQAAAAPAQLLGDLMQAAPMQPMQPPPMPAAAEVPLHHPQPMYSLAAGQLAQHGEQHGVAGDEQPEMDLSEDYSPGGLPAPMHRHPSLQQHPQQVQQQYPPLQLQHAGAGDTLASAPPLPSQPPPQLQPAAAAAAPLAAPPSLPPHLLQHPQQQQPASMAPPPLPMPMLAATAAAAPPPPAVAPSSLMPMAPAAAPLARVGGEPPGGSSTASDAAALAAQLTSNEQSAQALLEALLALPRENGNAGLGLAGLLQPEQQQQPPLQQHGGYPQHAQHAQQQQQGGDDDEYDPEDPFGD